MHPGNIWTHYMKLKNLKEAQISRFPYKPKKITVSNWWYIHQKACSSLSLPNMSSSISAPPSAFLSIWFVSACHLLQSLSDLNVLHLTYLSVSPPVSRSHLGLCLSFCLCCVVVEADWWFCPTAVSPWWITPRDEPALTNTSSPVALTHSLLLFDTYIHTHKRTHACTFCLMGHPV